MNEEEEVAKEEQLTAPAEVAPTAKAIPPFEVGAGGGQRVVVIDTTRMTPFQKIRFGVERK